MEGNIRNHYTDLGILSSSGCYSLVHSLAPAHGSGESLPNTLVLQSMQVVCCWEKTLKALAEQLVLAKLCLSGKKGIPKRKGRGWGNPGHRQGELRSVPRGSESFMGGDLFNPLQPKVNVPKDTKEKEGNEIAFLIHIHYTSIFLLPQSTNPNRATPIAFCCQPAHACKRNCKHSTSPHLPQTTWHLG